jgi:hypothetical protein
MAVILNVSGTGLVVITAPDATTRPTNRRCARLDEILDRIADVS